MAVRSRWYRSFYWRIGIMFVAFVVVLMSQTELEEGGYYQGEFYVLMICSVLGMVMMSSSRALAPASSCTVL